MKVAVGKMRETVEKNRRSILEASANGAGE